MMKISPKIISQLKQQYNYDPSTGQFTWKVDRPPMKRGDRAGKWVGSQLTLTCAGWRGISARQVAWWWSRGEWPTGHLTGRGDPDDLSAANLVLVRDLAAERAASAKAARPPKLPRTKMTREERLSRKRAQRLAYKYGLSVDDMRALLVSQQQSCAVCAALFSDTLKPCVDHNHETGAVRGLLCHACNVAAGHLKDDPERCVALANYLDTAPKA